MISNLGIKIAAVVELDIFMISNLGIKIAATVELDINCKAGYTSL
jgi:hypothetical protein